MRVTVPAFQDAFENELARLTCLAPATARHAPVFAGTIHLLNVQEALAQAHYRPFPFLRVPGDEVFSDIPSSRQGSAGTCSETVRLSMVASVLFGLALPRTVTSATVAPGSNVGRRTFRR